VSKCLRIDFAEQQDIIENKRIYLRAADRFHSGEKSKMSEAQSFEPSIGIITALSIEYLAMKALVDEGEEKYIDGIGKCLLGSVRSYERPWHSIVLAEAGMGNNLSALCAEKLRHEYPTIDTFIMLGIAGAVPHPESPENHVRLGDVVVVGREGIKQFDFVKQNPDSTEYRYPPRPPMARLLQAAHVLQREEEEGKYPWNKYIDEAINIRGDDWKRPAASTDRLEYPKGIFIEHPHDIKRRQEEPRIFIGVIASSNMLLKDPLVRNRLRDELKAKAVEMEASGVADASWINEVNYFAVRGTCDYCDPNKNDFWQKYAAIIASAYTKALVESVPSTIAKSNLRQGKKKTLTYWKNNISQT
jgi:nucleoside phosphorylase